MTASRPAVLQLVHGTNQPFLDLARHYANAVDRERYHVTTVFLTGGADPAVAERCAADEVHFLTLPRSALRGLKLGAIRRVRRLFRQRDYRLVIAQRYKAVYVGYWACRVPVLGVAHAFGVLRAASRRRLFRHGFKRLWWVGVSEAVSRDLAEAAGPTLAAHVTALPNCIDVDAVTERLAPRDAARKALGLAPDRFVFGNVGRLHPDKDPLALLEAFADAHAAMPDTELVFIGEGRLRSALAERIQARGLEHCVRLAGAVPDAARWFTAFDAYVSASDREPFGIVLLEAQAARLPVIAADCGGAAEVVGDSGLLYSRTQPAQLAERLRTVYRLTPDERRALGEKGRARLEARGSLAAFQARFRALPVVRDTLGASS